MLLNEGLELAMDWGESWLSPIQARLGQRRQGLRSDELDSINASCQEAMTLGHEIAYELTRRPEQSDNEERFAERMLALHPWINAQNVARLSRQSVYYASKTGGPPR